MLDAQPEVLAHNLETVRRLQQQVRDRRATYDQSLSILRHATQSGKVRYTKTSLMLGLGENDNEIEQAMDDAREAGCRHLHDGAILAADETASPGRGVRDAREVRSIARPRRKQRLPASRLEPALTQLVPRRTGVQLIEQGLPVLQRRLALWTFQTATVMAVLDSSIANVALPTISHELHASPTQSIWIVNAFQIVITATIFAFASLGELIGFEYVYRTGLTLFTFGSLLCALSHSLPQLIAARMLQGLGAAMIMGIQPGMIRRIYPPNMLGRGTGWMALTVATSAAAGPTLGGAILAIAHWSWLFMINVPIGTLDLIASFKTMPKFPTTGTWRAVRSRRRGLDRTRAQLLHARRRGRGASWN